MPSKSFIAIFISILSLQLMLIAGIIYGAYAMVERYDSKSVVRSQLKSVIDKANDCYLVGDCREDIDDNSYWKANYDYRDLIDFDSPYLGNLKIIHGYKSRAGEVITLRIMADVDRSHMAYTIMKHFPDVVFSPGESNDPIPEFNFGLSSKPNIPTGIIVINLKRPLVDF